MKKNISIIILIAIIAAVFSACTATGGQNTLPPPTTNPPVTQTPGSGDDGPDDDEKTPDGRLLAALSGEGSVSYSDELMKLFYEYYTQASNESGPRRNLELRLMPSFKEDIAENRDGLLFYIWNMAEYETRDSGEYFISAEEMKRTADMLFENPQYEDGETGELYFEDGGYIPVGWGILGATFYRLIDIEKDDSGVYTATFDGFTFDETDFLEEDERFMSPNMREYRGYFEDKGVEIPPITDGLLEIFASDNYHDILNNTEQVTVTFELSGSEKYPIRYLLCDRELNF